MKTLSKNNGTILNIMGKNVLRSNFPIKTQNSPFNVMGSRIQVSFNIPVILRIHPTSPLRVCFSLPGSGRIGLAVLKGLLTAGRVFTCLISRAIEEYKQETPFLSWCWLPWGVSRFALLLSFVHWPL